ncbi:GRAS family protein RAM1-like [Impatiens glandulifera]|uniref:GRAS family protein RAM1-like n=1 Tax=Impatiens glandulifera TaxID=253017 RepID=UPI001FB0AC04|nr:GRAS family protein RAM1-like [Impatiens glandulifera]
METQGGDEEPLSLRLTIARDSNYEKKRKRKRIDYIDSLNLSSPREENIFGLLRLREQIFKKNNNIKGYEVKDVKGLHLIQLLLMSAASVDKNNIDLAFKNLIDLYGHVSLTGDSVQRMVAHFADGLVARVLTARSPFYDMLMKEPTQEEKLMAFIHLYRASPLYQFAHFTSNQAIIEAFEKEEERNNRALHVIDFDISYGLQWPSLMQSLAEKATSTNPISLRITGFGETIEQLKEVEARLISFAEGFFHLAFEFQGLLGGSQSELLKLVKHKNETVAINLMCYLNTTRSFTNVSEILSSSRSLNPSIVFLVEREGSWSQRGFLKTFMDSLHYFAAIFDSLEECLPLDNPQRLDIERNHLGREIKWAMNDHYKEEEETWKDSMERKGFEGIELSSRTIMQARLLVKIRSQCNGPSQLNVERGGGFRVSEREDGKAISLTWQERCLVTASAWSCI